MPDQTKLNRPLLVAVWPGMGQVAVSAGFYLMSKLPMHMLGEFEARELFDVDLVTVRGGLLRPIRLPQSRLFVWHDPQQVRDLVVFIGEAQPPVGRYSFCRRLIQVAAELGVERVFTFAAMATESSLEDAPRVFGAAIDDNTLNDFKQSGLTLLEDGQIGGLNGVLLGAAQEAGMKGGCLLGEMPHLFAQMPFPKASLAVLEAFHRLSGIQVDLAELAAHVRSNEAQLSAMLEQLRQTVEAAQTEEAEEESEFPIPPIEEELGPDDKRRIEEYFELAQRDRAKAYELKQELDRLGVFREYEDRFLDLFKKQG